MMDFGGQAENTEIHRQIENLSKDLSLEINWLILLAFVKQKDGPIVQWIPACRQAGNGRERRGS
jgi:hypothetical protein